MYCRILLQELTKTEFNVGYSIKGLKHLTSENKFNPMLPFKRAEFIQHKPILQKGMSISGYQPKLQLIIQNHQFDIQHAGGNYILKPSPEAYPFLAENEHATMAVMRALKFDVPPNGLVFFQTDNLAEAEYAYVIKRYDRKGEEKIHQEQLDGAMNVPEKYGKIRANSHESYISYEQVVLFLLAHLGKTLALQKELFRRIVYAYLLGNNDLHLRNFSIIHGEKLTLAPIYDFIATAPYTDIFNGGLLALPLLKKEEGNAELAFGFETQYGCYIGVDFIEFGRNIGLSEKLTKKLLSDLIKEQTKVEEIYHRSFMPQPDIEKVLTCYRQRLGYLQIFEAEKL